MKIHKINTNKINDLILLKAIYDSQKDCYFIILDALKEIKIELQIELSDIVKHIQRIGYFRVKNRYYKGS